MIDDPRRSAIAISLAASLACAAASAQTPPPTPPRDATEASRQTPALPPPIAWEADIGAALALSKQTGRPVAAYFTFDT